MRLTQLIAAAQTALDEHGDIEVMSPVDHYRDRPTWNEHTDAQTEIQTAPLGQFFLVFGQP